MISANEARAGSESFAEKTSVQAIYTAIEPELMRMIEEDIRLAMANGENRASMDLGDLVRCLVTKYLVNLNIRDWWDVYTPLKQSGGFLRIYKTVETVLKSWGYQVRIGKREDEWIAPRRRAKKWLTISWDHKD